MTVEGADALSGVNCPDLDGLVPGATDDEVVYGEDRVDSLGVTVEGVDMFTTVNIPDLDGVVL